MNIPNQLTCARIALTAVFLWLVSNEGFEWKLAALLVFLTASATDWLDGQVARRTGQITPFGQLMDPIADKLLVLSALGSFAKIGLIPAWTFFVVLVRDLLVTGLRFTMPAGTQEPMKSGKQKTAFQFFFIVASLAFFAARETSWWDPRWTGGTLLVLRLWMFAVVAMTIWSGGRYLLAKRPLSHRA